ncbi:MAG: hypothetical protein II453_12145 [Alphaproteobacteria bacterium]|nr:hypothetical protein [Alphaproteobacteria bacterium]
MDLFKFEEEKNARLEYNTMLGEGVPEVLAGQNLADKYGKELAEKVIKELRGWDEWNIQSVKQPESDVTVRKTQIMQCMRQKITVTRSASHYGVITVLIAEHIT